MKHAETMAELCELAAGCVSDELGAAYVCVQIADGGQRAVSAVGDAGWSPLAQGVLIRIADTKKPLVRLLGAGDEPGHAIVGTSMAGSTEGTGAVVAVVECVSLADARASLRIVTEFSRLLELAVDGLNTRLRQRTEEINQLSILSRSMTYDSTTQYCYAIANGLRVELDVNLVAVGLVDQETVRLKCVSGLDDFDTSSPGSRLILESMEEAVDAGRTVYVQEHAETDSDLQSDGHPLTAKWQQSVSGAAVASVPLVNMAGDCVAVISVQAHYGRSLTSSQLQMVSNLTDSLVAAVALITAAKRSLLRHGMDSVSRCSQKMFGRLGVQTVAFVLAVIAVSGWMMFGVVDHVVRTPCTIVAARTRHLAAPRESVLDQVLVRPGEIVEQGQLLAVLDTRTLTGERDRAEAELRAAQIEIVTAAQEGVPALIGHAVSRRRKAEADLDRISQQLEQSRILSPFRGQIISDDLSERTGEMLPMGELLFEIVPDGELAVQLDLPESVLAFVEPGQRGSFSLNAHPGSAQECQLVRIEPEAAPGKTGIVVSGQARIEDQAAWLRPGMQGVVLVNTGERPVWWVWLHKVIDVVNYEMWSLSGSVGPTDS